MNSQLKSLFDLDQSDHALIRTPGAEGYDEMRKRDAARRDQVRTIIAKADLLDAIDFYHAAWILNHGDNVADAEVAFALAEKSFELGHEPAKWLFAAAYDRWCMYRGQPQKFGTQIVPDGQRYRVWDTATDTTDEERQRYNVPSIAEMHARAERDSEEIPQPPMEFVPSWLKAAISRWNQKTDD